MFASNPFEAWAQGASVPTDGLSWGVAAPAPSVFGALPYPADPSTMHSFFFTSYNPNMFNCTIVGPKARPYYQITTDNQMPGYTVVRNMDGQSVSLIEWQQSPAIEIRGMVPKQHVKTWLRLSPNGDSRAMEVRGMKYLWVPRDRAINLYAAGAGTPTFVGRVSRTNGVITLEMTTDGVQLGILEPTITACLLMQCGRNID